MDHDIAVQSDLTGWARGPARGGPGPMPVTSVTPGPAFESRYCPGSGTPGCVSESPSRVIRRRQRALTDIGRQIRRSALCHMKCYEVKQSAPRARSLFQIKHMHRASRWVSAVISYTRGGRGGRLWDDPQNHGIIGFATLAAIASTIDSRYKPDAVHTYSPTS